MAVSLWLARELPAPASERRDIGTCSIRPEPFHGLIQFFLGQLWTLAERQIVFNPRQQGFTIVPFDVGLGRLLHAAARIVRVEQAQELDLLICAEKLARNLVGQYAAE